MISFTEGVEVIQEVLTPEYLKVVISPLFKGYGTTLGNSLRRVLLSSIEGSKIVALRFNNLPHEFTYIPGIKEDGSRIILNARNLVVDLIGDYTSENPKLVTVRKYGPGTISGADIVDGEVRVVNPEHIIVSVEDEMMVEIDLYLAKGIGYVSYVINKESNSNYPTETIVVDTFYSPVMKVNFQVEPTRVGREIDYDKLTMELWVNKAVDPWSAFRKAVSILKSHLEVLEKPTLISEKIEFQKSPIQALELKKRIEDILLREGYSTIGKLIAKDKDEILELKGLGVKALEEIETKLAERGLNLKGG